MSRTVARKFSIREVYVYAEWLDILKFETNSTDLKCFIFQFGRVWSFVWGV